MNLNIMNEFGTDVIQDWPVQKQAMVSGLIENNNINPDHGWLYAGLVA